MKGECKHLDFDGNFTGCKIVENWGRRWWQRSLTVAIDGNTRVQFCKLRGRINRPFDCTEPGFMYCYEVDEAEVESIIRVPDITPHSKDSAKIILKRVDNRSKTALN